MAFPSEVDARFLLKRIYADITNKDGVINAGRSTDHYLAMRTVIRNSGSKVVGKTNEALGSNRAGITVQYARFPTPDQLYNIVWGPIPDFIKDKIRQWAKEDQNGDREGFIGEAIAEFVKTALGALPIPVPGLFLNGVVNLVVPPLVRVIMSRILQDSSKTVKAFGITYLTTPNTHYVMRELDCKILLSSGLRVKQLPAHLQTPMNLAASGDDGGDDNDDSDDDPVNQKVLSSTGQPDNDEAAVGLKQFYKKEATNGCKPLNLDQIMAAQGRTDPECDGDPTTFGAKVWSTIQTDDKNKNTHLGRDIKGWAEEKPPNRTEISGAIYPTVKEILPLSPYYVPESILDSFTAMKVPEATEYLVKTFG